MVAVAAVLVAGCGVPGEEPWAAEAEAWFAGHDRAYADASLEHVLYYAPDGVNDTWDFYAEGRWAVGMLQSIAFDYEHIYGPLYLSTDEAVRTHIIVAEPVPILLAHHQMSEDGIERHTHLAHSEYPITIRDLQREAMALAEQVAAAHVTAWNSADPALIGQLYAPDATLTDDLHGLSAQGLQDIGALAAAAGAVVAQTNAEVLPQRVLELAPGVTADAPAVFVTFELDRAHLPTQVWLIVHSVAPCPGAAAIGLDLDEEQRVTAERRYASVASIRECIQPADAPQGWWTGRELPLPLGERVTGSLETAAGPVEIRNGWPPADTSVLWAFDQFTAAGLPAPMVSAVAFDPFDDRCEEAPGYAEWSGGATQILICFDSPRIGEPDFDAAGRPSQLHLLLHEISHAWLVTHAGEETREAFMANVGVDNWNDRGQPWRERGVEWAAESLAWGLQGTPTNSLALGSPRCAVLAEGFRILTGAEPLTACVSDSGS